MLIPTFIALTLTLIAAIVAGTLGLAHIELGRVILLGAPISFAWWLILTGTE
jgi:hypothetical protein